jgi:hypothetical protein
MRDCRNSQYGGAYNGRPNSGAWAPAPTLPWVSMLRAWSDMLCAFTPGCWPQAQQPVWNSGYSSYETSPRPPITVVLGTDRPVSVEVFLHPGAECLKLKCTALIKSEKEEILGVTIYTLQGAVTIKIPLDLGNYKETGTYRGKIEGPEGMCVGHLQITLSSPLEQPSANNVEHAATPSRPAKKKAKAKR